MARYRPIARIESDIRKLEAQRAKAVERKKGEVRDSIEGLLRETGLTLRDLYGGRPLRSARFINPNKPTETWSGRGRRPDWLASALSKGAVLEDFARRA